MLTPIALLLLTVCVAGWSLWERRHTWTCPWERWTNAVIILLVGTVSLHDRTLGQFLSDPLHRLLGVWNVEDVLGDASAILAAGVMCHLFVYRLLGRSHVQDFMNRRVVIPGSIAVALVSALFVAGQGWATEGAVTHIPVSNVYLQAYKVTMSLIMIYLLSLATRALWILRREGRHRDVAHAYLASCLIGMGISIVRIGNALLGIYLVPSWVYASIVSVSIAAFCYGSMMSWERKISRLQELVTPERREPEPLR